MEREILFRGRCCDSGSWHEGMPVRASEPPYSICAIDIPEKHACVQIDPETCGEYTGLTDRNGVKIFEGDILKRGKHKYVVEWCDDCAMFVLPCITDETRESDFTVFYGYEFEVISNVHDNPEMLGDKANV